MKATNNLLNKNDAYAKRWITVVTIMMVAILEVLDSTIVNVALPHMMPSLGANQNQITWILTSYIISSAIMLPLTGFFSSRIGQKQLLLINITGFMITSILCGTSRSLLEIVIFRVFQGLFGASLIPLSQSILRATFPLEEQGKAMAIWGIGVMAAPIFGPTVGGFITEHANWRWIFYINLPVCLLGLILTLFVIPETERCYYQRIDWLGLGLMVIGSSTLQIFLDKGNENDWLNSGIMLFFCSVAFFCIICFIIRSLTYSTPVIKLKIFKDYNFRISCLVLSLFSGALFSFITLEPILLERLFYYSALTAGWIMAPLGIASVIAIIFVPQLMKNINIKLILMAGMLFCAYGVLRFTHINLNSPIQEFLSSNAILGFGMGLLMIPLTTYSLATLSKGDITEGAGLYSYSRMLGTSIGISLISTLVTRVTQINWNTLSSYITIYNPSFYQWMNSHQLPFLSPLGIKRLGLIIQQQASLLGFLDGFRIIFIVFILLIPLLLVLKTVELRSSAAPSAMFSHRKVNGI
ncbi:DHA2 family efflux MFS transporter permease subunit [Coxiella endosymbiont of Amblyomma americanum]|uniref:DHA2 family efflux MFS transporter permease subunit n=1 Tax=Coxiella endosymbiont of Amblyomma americanum TaxID=325775 RepID=UPI00058203DB|nr:DHA2 family efflux MFS transporter permease subunit [Coxiella endosymbiont of Amblyomma americanum]AJC50542.1 MFS transporter [Coxiella endosymbiont of Amblyomma americanum]AUJ58876.1 MFS transporter [Coxiella-like endosymbiont of Amblyomma americanum]